MNEADNTPPATEAGGTAPRPAASAGPDPLAVFATPSSETGGVLVDVEHPSTGKVLMSFRVARFGGANTAALIRAERQLKGKLPQGVRRQIDAGGGDPEVVNRLNRQVFTEVSVLGWEIHDPALKERWGEFSKEKASQMFEAYPRMYDLVSEKAVDEETFAGDQLEDALGNSATA